MKKLYEIIKWPYYKFQEIRDKRKTKKKLKEERNKNQFLYK
jgi:hypothetical protein